METIHARYARVERPAAVAGLLLLLFVGYETHIALWRFDLAAHKPDIYYSWVEGQRIVTGENPYARILQSDMRRNDKYATYFPLFYLLSAGVQLAGFEEFADWILVWRYVSLTCILGITVLLFYALSAAASPTIGVAAAAFWLLNRWTLNLSVNANIEPLPILLLLVAAGALGRHMRLACLCYGVSLALKQNAIFLLPLFLTQVWLAPRAHPGRRVLVAAILVASVPIVTSIPFLMWDAEAYVRSILFSATRIPGGHFKVFSFDAIAGSTILPGLVGLPAKIPMLLLMTLICVGALQRTIGFYIGCLLIMSTFVDFNSVLFRQYMAWVVPFVPLALCDRSGRQTIG